MRRLTGIALVFLVVAMLVPSAEASPRRNMPDGWVWRMPG